MFEEQSQSSREEPKYGRASVLPATSEPAWEMEFAPVGENPPTAPPDESYDVSRRSSRDFVQDGVRGMEAISLAWTGWSLLVPYCRYVYTTLIHSQTDIWSADGKISLLLTAFVTSLEGQVTSPLLSLMTKPFQQHSLLSTTFVVRDIIYVVAKPPIAKFADVFGRLEAFCLTVSLLIIGSTGLLLVQQIFIADTTDLPNRALFSTLPDLPYLVTVWIGDIIGDQIVDSSGSWRWAFGMWTLILPIAFIPLAYSLFINGRKASRMGLGPRTYTTLQGGLTGIPQNLWRDLDIGGIILLSLGLSLILIPCSIAGYVSGGWANGNLVAMVTMGAIFLVIFPFWEASSRFARKRGIEGRLGSFLGSLAPYPLIPLRLLKSSTFSAGCLLAVFYFMAFYLSVQPHLYSYLIVVRNFSVSDANYVLKVFYVTATVSSLIVSVFIKISNRYKWFVTGGSCVYLLGIGLMIQLRGEPSRSAIVASQILIGIGGGILNVPAQLGVQASAGHQNVGVATAIFLSLVSVGGAIGSAISSALWERYIPSKLQDYLPDGEKSQARIIYEDFNEALEYPVGSPARDAIIRSYRESMTVLLIIAVVIAVLVVACSLFMEDFSLSMVQQGVTGRVVGGQVDENQWKKGDKRSYLRKALDLIAGRPAPSV
ncbi:unnamed protein product [Clonostachys chloroleuca]|uniref:Major facilitator superfamily (MFS) profile domain-containing protein n=1 Tax=Clonostachys chloroleuca TaxID=1926264 RepID=A0AA35M917_9HYPO|nr:unnamed protein product [Clonostachys chloroleuca]